MDHGHKGPWERLVIEQAYQEFRMQAQFYNRKNNDTSYAELLRTVPEAEKLPYLVSGAILVSVMVQASLTSKELIR